MGEGCHGQGVSEVHLVEQGEPIACRAWDSRAAFPSFRDPKVEACLGLHGRAGLVSDTANAASAKKGAGG